MKKNAQNTISLLKVLFKDLTEAHAFYEVLTENLSDSERFVSERFFSNGGNTSFLFNNTKESANLDESLFGQHILDKFPGWKQEVPKLLKSWCLFSDREFFWRG